MFPHEQQSKKQEINICDSLKVLITNETYIIINPKLLLSEIDRKVPFDYRSFDIFKLNHGQPTGVSAMPKDISIEL